MTFRLEPPNAKIPPSCDRRLAMQRPQHARAPSPSSAWIGAIWPRFCPGGVLLTQEPLRLEQDGALLFLAPNFQGIVLGAMLFSLTCLRSSAQAETPWPAS